jgi:hypothetical protein
MPHACLPALQELNVERCMGPAGIPGYSSDRCRLQPLLHPDPESIVPSLVLPARQYSSYWTRSHVHDRRSESFIIHPRAVHACLLLLPLQLQAHEMHTPPARARGDVFACMHNANCCTVQGTSHSQHLLKFNRANQIALTTKGLVKPAAKVCKS